MSTIETQLKTFIRKNGQSNYALCKAAGIEQSALSRFMHGQRGLDLTTIEKLAKHFRLELRQRPLPDRSMEQAASAYQLRQAQEIVDSACGTQSKGK